MTVPRVSVLISVHDGEATLPATLESIRAQTFGDLEIVVVNDGSTDGTAALLRGCTDPRLRVIEQPRAGLTKALNAGLRTARGEIIARLDADDTAHPERIAVQVEALDRDPELGLLGSWADIVDERGRVIRRERPPVDDAAIRAQLLWDNAFLHSAIAFRRGVVERVGRYDEAVARSQDYDLVWRVSRVAALANIPRPLLRWRRSVRSISSRHRDEQRRSAAATSLRALREALGIEIDRERFARLRAVWDGDADRLLPGDGDALAWIVARLPEAAGRTVWMEFVAIAAAAAPRGEAVAIVRAAWSRFPRERSRLAHPKRAARIVFGSSALAAGRLLRPHR